MKVIDLRGKTMGGQDKRSRITKIARHHSATTEGDAFTFERYWKNSRGWRTGGYHEIILRDGTVQLCYDHNVVTNGIYRHNQTAYHICLVGNGNFTDAQERAFEERAKYNIKRFNLSVNDVLGHGEFSGASTSCPGTDMNKVRARLKASNTEVKAETISKKPSKIRDSTVEVIQSTLNSRYNAKIEVDGIYGPITKRALIKGYQTELNKQFNRNLVVDGIWGIKTKIASVTVRKGAKGYLTWTLQSALYCNGYDPVKIDAIFGSNTEKTVRKYQKDKKILVDGIAGKNTFEKLFA